MTNSKTYMCEAEADNCKDKNAVLVKCTENNEIIGHVPALPIPLNKAFRQIMNLDASISIQCVSMGDPKPSEYPWPEPCVRGGEVMQPVQYKISANARCGQIIDILRHTASQLPDILSQMEIHVEYAGERTPPMILSSDDTPGTPDYRSYTP